MLLKAAEENSAAFSFSTRGWCIMGGIDLCVESILMADSAFTGNVLKATADGSVFE